MFELKPTWHLEVHTLKSHAVSNLNRDQSGRPKISVNGGCQRLRESPQAEIWSFKESQPFKLFMDAARKNYDAVDMESTRIARDAIKNIILKKWQDHPSYSNKIAEEINLSLDTYASAFSKNKVSNEITSQNITYSYEELKYLAELVVKLDKNGKLVVNNIAEEIKKIGPEIISYGTLNPILALIGRFTASNVSYLGTVQSPLQVAHAETVHESLIQRDYFAAVDTLNNSQGFSHGGTQFFGTGVYYHYYCLDVRLLADNMRKAFPKHSGKQQADLTNGVIKALIYAILTRNPVGQQSRHANNDIPDLAYLTYGNCFPYSAQSSFEKPVKRSRDGGYFTNAIERFKNWRTTRQARFQNFLGDEIYWGIDKDSDSEFRLFVPWVAAHTKACIEEVLA